MSPKSFTLDIIIIEVTDVNYADFLTIQKKHKAGRLEPL